MTVAERPRAATYPPRIQEFARRLYADGEGKTIDEIRQALAKRGYTPKRDTIIYWVDEEYREEKLHRQRTYRPPGPPRKKAWRYRLERMEELRDLRLSFRAIAALMSHDFDDLDLAKEQVESILRGKLATRSIRRLLWPKGSCS